MLLKIKNSWYERKFDRLRFLDLMESSFDFFDAREYISSI